MIEKHYLEDISARFIEAKSIAEKAIAQVDDDQFFHLTDDESNSIALIVKHISGNLRSRWTNFLTSDGEKPDRNRDSEFERQKQDSRQNLMNRWNEGWQLLFDTLSSLQPDDLLRTVTIRGQIHTVVQAINRQLFHYSYHIGQIVFLAKFLTSSQWQSLSIPKRPNADKA